MSGFPGYRDIIRRLNAPGLEFHRQQAAGTTILNHPGDMLEGTLCAILKQAGIEPEVFLQKK